MTSNPLGVVVLINGKNVGLTPFKGQVSTGRHEVHVAVKGLKNLPPPKAVTLDLGDQEQISFVLKLRSSERIVDGVLVDKYAGMVLIPAGNFQMGSNDGQDNEKPVDKVSVDAF